MNWDKSFYKFAELHRKRENEVKQQDKERKAKGRTLYGKYGPRIEKVCKKFAKAASYSRRLSWRYEPPLQRIGIPKLRYGTPFCFTINCGYPQGGEASRGPTFKVTLNFEEISVEAGLKDSRYHPSCHWE